MSAVPWYATGTVAVTNGSANVVGSSTLWSANVDTGQGFIGPDFSLYEIATVVSDTHITLKTNYRGSTVGSGGAYVIPPIQGYTRAAAIELAALLASLGGFNDAIAAAVDGDFLQYLSGSWQPRTPAQVLAAVGGNRLVMNFTCTNIATKAVSTVLYRHKALVNFTIPSVANGLILGGEVDTGPSSQTDFLILKNGSTIATARWAASGLVPSAIDGADVAFVAGTDYLDLKSPANFNGMSGAFSLGLIGLVT